MTRPDTSGPRHAFVAIGLALAFVVLLVGVPLFFAGLMAERDRPAVASGEGRDV